MKILPLRIWLALVATFTVVMVLVGGVTRLTESGLSMTDWKPILGTVPPRSDADWAERFDQYKASPQFEKMNPDMNLEGFKRIFFWEWFHRVLGRAIGLLALLPWLGFTALRWIRGAWVGRLFLVPLLVLLQGIMGWVMVKSGLVDVPRVSALRLAAHLGLAVLLLCYCVWQFVHLAPPRQPAPNPVRRRRAWMLVVLLAGQAFLGALVAGNRWSLVAMDWPTMNGRWIPSFEPGAPVIVHFAHRTFAWLVAAAAVFLAVPVRSRPGVMRQNTAVSLVLVLILVQMVLGVLTILQGRPIPMASAHQVNAALLTAAAIWAACEFGR